VFATNNDVQSGVTRDARLQFSNCTDPSGGLIEIRAASLSPHDRGTYASSITFGTGRSSAIQAPN